MIGRTYNEKLGGLCGFLGHLVSHADAKHAGLVDLVVSNGGDLGLDVARRILVGKRKETTIEKFFTNGGTVFFVGPDVFSKTVISVSAKMP